MKPSGKQQPAFRDAQHRSSSASAFNSGAVLYDAIRPSYPPSVPALIADLPQRAGGTRILDVGAGTGKLTELLGAGADSESTRRVLACDPSADMVRVLRDKLPNVPAWRATAEATGLADGAVDAVTCAQTWHWVDTATASAEAARITSPGGKLLLCWNTLAVNHPWVLRLSRIMHSGDVQRAGFYPDVATPWTLEGEVRDTWAQIVTTDECFELMASRSYWLRANEKTRAKMVANLDWYLHDRLGFERGQRIPLPYRADAFVYGKEG
ncbi:class I SAM-dependent methyltransferase [Corynebacterium sp. Marseille-P8863]|uniref:class I SAM-dependent methyltransferase n=1 Tax=Corynebacterium sp. Marseille-P8863 TaxID=2866576 RepID=UPI002263CF51|nr:class I SAM-dependent methyltransferase [Corynebacterium sp. Marseille-P8863]